MYDLYLPLSTIAISFPIPCEEPVTTATLFFNFTNYHFLS